MNWSLLQNSLLVAAGSAVLAALWGATAALHAATLRPPARNLIFGAAVVAFALPPFLVANTWLHYFGLAGTLRGAIPFELFSLPATILLIALQLWPVPFFFALHGLLRIERAYLELDPMLEGQMMVNHVIWPALRGGFWQSFAIAFVLGLNNFSIPALLQTKVYAAEVWLSFNTQFDYGAALRLSWPLILGPLLLLGLLRRGKISLVFRSVDFPVRLFRKRLGPVRHPAACFGWSLVGLAVFLPLFQLLSSPRTWAELGSAIAAGHSATLNSLLFAGGSALLVLAASLGLQHRAFPFFFWTLFLVPGALLGIALIWLFNRPALNVFYGSAAIVLLAYLLRFVAFGWAGLRVAASSFDQAPIQVVRAFGGSPWQQFRLAVWPQSRNLVVGTFLIVYLMCLWEVETLILIVPPGRETLALRIFNMLHYGHAGQVNALCVWLLALALAPVLVLGVALKIRGAALGLVLAACLAGMGCAPEQPGAKLESQLFGSVQVIGSRGTGAGQFNKPRSVALDRQDNLYVVDMTGRVQKFTPDGQFLLLWQMPQTDKGKPKGMVQDAEGNIIVIEPHYSRVNHFDASGHLLAQWGQHGTNLGQLTFPRSAALNSAGEIFLSEYGQLERVLRFAPGGRACLGAIGSGGVQDGQFNRPEGIGIGPDDRLYVADSCNHRVQVFDRSGSFLHAFGSAGGGAGQMSYPYDVRVDARGLRFVCEFGNSRVQVFDEQNKPIEIVGSAGGEPGQMNNPWSIALDSRGNLYVADAGNHRVQKFIRREPLAGRPLALKREEAAQ